MTKVTKALITGITGQDGAYIAESLLSKGYQVFGMYRRRATDPFDNIDHIKNKINLVSGDLCDGHSIQEVVEETNPDEVYNLGAQSFVKVSFNQPHVTRDINFYGVDRLLHSLFRFNKKIRFYQASTSEMFGDVLETPQSEFTPFNPVSPYGEAKLAAHELVKEYRKRGMFCCGGILFNHESPRRGLQFVTRKITHSVAKIHLGLQDKLSLGNLNAERDWGHAIDYVEAMWLMLQQDTPDDYVIATGKKITVRDFVELAFKKIGREIEWVGEGLDEKGYSNGQVVVDVDEKFFRPNEVNLLLGDPSKAKKELGWEPRASLEDLVFSMVQNDLTLLEK
ncbi:MAG: GDP-mannose 4,6-dehydratase [Candidatus Nanoarchaeia archaeon]|jgi:GDPmannose 4,6-dehydratase|nr:GDP-mannose 4,6-dehydratase [Candidatus Nanoarchaeia archaeon]|tara:strand:- start:23009 stop:24019 length:1011 start_codon:yes stop_codon:yes gene_type:complete